ncbi:PucR family transcriptional regulator [Meiothermus sp. CFH 77666]|uniref:PucR family transcriptional regulator n=1 Tax=Meiothermus sp. CFH 77666 TaxID=2817942 RepID=UPI001AA01BE2|nr:PucR family transcriptional regulator [Meiothermus sp. CFH 77666]MBO1435700.1 PucR family transcriptional regulator [Meiothermus sp. CFH 77666]
MSLPTLRQILELPAFAGAELLSGQAKLDSYITWVHVAEVLDVARLLSGGELVLCTGLELARATPEARVAYVRSLAEAGVGGLGLELVQGLREVPAEMLQTARMLQFPILVFRSEVRFADLTRAAHERILRPGADREEPLLESLLEALVETGRDKSFLQRQLGTVLSLPSRPRSTLLATLEALLASQFNIAETARKLGVRRQSIYYRLEQLKGMLGDLDSPERRLGLWVALELLKRPG